MRTGRPSKLTADLLDKVVKLVEKGHYPETVAQSVGIDPSTYRNWMRWGSEGKAPYLDFFLGVARARALAEINLGSAVLRGDGRGEGFGQAKAAAFMLERTRSAKFSQRVNLKVQDELERFLDVAQRICNESDYSALLEALASGDSEATPGQVESTAGGEYH